MSPVVVVFYISLIIKYSYCEVITATTNGNKICDGSSDCTINCNSNSTHGYCQNDMLQCPLNTYNCTINCNGQNACYLSNIICPTNANCDISCNGFQACSLSNIIWPTAPNIYGTLICDMSQYVCHGINFPIPNPNKPLIITCGVYGCFHANLICPTNSNCTVQCIGSSSCREANIIWPIATYGNILCNGAYACQDTDFPIPDPDIPLTVTCASTGECWRSLIICPTNSDCTVHCIDDFSCYQAQIIWPTLISAVTTLTCETAQSPCSFVTEPTIINAPNTKDYILQCVTSNQCQGYIVNCPADYGCWIDCSADYACKDMIINWVETQPYNIQCGSYQSACRGVQSIKSSNQSAALHLYCYQPYTCARSIIYCPQNADCIIDCWGISQSCTFSTIYGPINHRLTVICTGGTMACYHAVIFAEDTSSFRLHCPTSGLSACGDMTIHFPPNINGTKVAIIDTGSGGELNGFMKFYAINGWLDVDISNYNGNDYGNTGIFYCGIDYILSCPMSGSEWFAGCGICDSPNITTDSPTYTPTVITSPPTNYPTTSIPTTNNPTSSMPTTSIPTTINPTTIVPTTNIPITAIPVSTTINPTTIVPTTNIPITAIPVSTYININTTTNEGSVDETTETATEYNKEDTDNASGNNIAIILTIVLIVTLIVIILLIVFIHFKWHNKKKRNNYNTTHQIELENAQKSNSNINITNDNTNGNYIDDDNDINTGNTNTGPNDNNITSGNMNMNVANDEFIINDDDNDPQHILINNKTSGNIDNFMIDEFVNNDEFVINDDNETAEGDKPQNNANKLLIDDNIGEIIKTQQ